jgi:hypothetical protein
MSRTDRRYRKREGRKVWVFSELRTSPDQKLLNDALIQHSLEQARLEAGAQAAHEGTGEPGQEVVHDTSA